jgi:putative hydrolase of the HAD superfamily
MIGDDLVVDIEGARSLGMDTMFFNPNKTIHESETTFEIQCWEEIFSYL